MANFNFFLVFFTTSDQILAEVKVKVWLQKKIIYSRQLKQLSGGNIATTKN